MHDIIARYKQIEPQLRTPNAELELYYSSGRIILHTAARYIELSTLGCMVIPLGFIFVFSHFPFISRTFSLSAYAVVIIVTLMTMVKNRKGVAWCKIEPESQEFKIIKHPSVPESSLLLDDINCFVGEFRWQYDGDKVCKWPTRRLYVVSQNGKMYLITTQSPNDETGKSICEHLGFICNKPSYMVEESMPKAKFISKNANDLMFNIDEFLIVNKDFRHIDADK